MKRWGRTTLRTALGAAAIVVGSLWLAAFFSTFDSTAYGYGAPQVSMNQPGRVLFEWGWLGPVAGSVAWYANLLLPWIMVRMARGKQPGFKLPLIAAALALSAFLPGFMYDFEQDGRFHPTVVYGPAVWLWVSAFAIPAMIGLCSRGYRSEKSA